MTLTCCQDHILTENIWFVWSETSYSGDERRCNGCGTTNEQTLKIELLSQWKLEAEFRNIKRLPFRDGSRNNSGGCCGKRHLRRKGEKTTTKFMMNNIKTKYLKEERCECWSNHNTRVVNKPRTQAIKHVRPLKICHHYILFLTFQKCKTGLW